MDVIDVVLSDDSSDSVLSRDSLEFELAVLSEDSPDSELDVLSGDSSDPELDVLSEDSLEFELVVLSEDTSGSLESELIITCITFELALVFESTYCDTP